GTGENMAEKTEGNKKTSSFSAKTVRDFALVLSQKFRVLEHFEDGVKIKYYYYKDEKPSESLKTGALALATFSDMIGKYPYSTFSIVETNFVHGGMEYPNLIYISDSLSSYEEYTNVIVHETAHQWFYNMVGSNANVSSWLDEGLTEYVTACFYESNPQYLIEKKKIVENALSNYSLFVSVYGNVFGEVDTSMNRRLNEFKSEAEYVYVVYVKGMLLFDSLKSIVGEKDFLKGLKNYFENNKFGIAEPKNLISEFEKASRKDLSTFFDTWIGGKIVIVSLN
ncbi:MAG: M1 family aminopeptidase, partial [Clostridia bacterium]